MNRRERNELELWILAIAGIVLLWWLTMSDATPLYLVPDPNCVQTQWAGEIPFDFDPNTVAGVLIDVEQVTAGKYNRVGRYCDPEGDAVTMQLLVGPDGMQVTQDIEAGTWTLAGDVSIGVHAIIVHAIDEPEYGEPNDVVVTVLVEARPRPNTPPALN